MIKTEKKCKGCQLVLPIREFYRKNKIYYHTVCIKCTKKQTLKRQRNSKKLCIEHKGYSCEKCGYNQCDAVMEFHHKNPNEKDFSIGTKHSAFNDVIRKELDKCILLCANCHREEHIALNKVDKPTHSDFLITEGKICIKCKEFRPSNYFLFGKAKNKSKICKQCNADKTSNRLKQYKLLAVKYKGEKCQCCGYANNVGVLEFHHREPKEKEIILSSFSGSLEKFKLELDKCDMLCANCHRAKHWQLS